MRKDDPVLYYHSLQELAVVGIMTVTREAYPDPTSKDSHWLNQTLTHALSVSILAYIYFAHVLNHLTFPRRILLPIDNILRME